MMQMNHLPVLAATMSGIEDSLIAAAIFTTVTALLTLMWRWGWIATAKHRGMTGYYVGTAKVVSLFPDEPQFPRIFDVCYQIGYSKIPRRFRIDSYSRIKNSEIGVGIDTCRGGWKENDYVSLEYSKQKKLTASFGRSILKFVVADYDKKMLNGTAVGVSKGMFEGKDVVYAAELRLFHSDNIPAWVKINPNA